MSDPAQEAKALLIGRRDCRKCLWFNIIDIPFCAKNKRPEDYCKQYRSQDVFNNIWDQDRI